MPDQRRGQLADPASGSLWACMGHADEILLTVPTAFIASEGAPGLAGVPLPPPP